MNALHQERTISRHHHAGPSLFDQGHVIATAERHKTELAKQLERQRAVSLAVLARNPYQPD